MAYDSAGLVQRRVVNGLVLGLRSAFTQHVQFPYVEAAGEWDLDNSRIFISSILPLEPAKYPQLIVNSVPGEEQRYLGPDSYGDIISPSVGGLTVTHTRNFTSMPMTASIEIYTRDTVTQDSLQSAVYDSLKTSKDVLAESGVEIRQQRWLAPQRKFVNDRWWIVVPLSLDLYAEWVNDTPILSTVGSISITFSVDV